MNLNFESGNPQSLIKEVRETIQVAEELQVSVEGAMKGIEDALLNLDQKLFFTIMMYPASWANLGKRLNSSSIYQEAIIHIVGRWNSLSPVAMGTLEPCTRELCKRKHLELLLKKRTIEFRMLSYYPPKLQSAQTEIRVALHMPMTFTCGWRLHSFGNGFVTGQSTVGTMSPTTVVHISIGLSDQ